jgi:hypothetical protein
MKDFKSGFNPFSPENHSILLTTLLVLLILGTLFVLTLLADKYIIPRLDPNNKFRLWFEKHIIDINPFDKN